MSKTKKTDEKAVTKAEESQVVAVKQMTAIEGMEGFGAEDLQIPRLKLLQGLSEEVADGIAPAGSLGNSITKDIVARLNPETKSAGVTIIPLMWSKSRIYFVPRDIGQGIYCRSWDGKYGEGDPGGECAFCPKGQWDRRKDANGALINEPPECTELVNVFSIIRGYDYPIPLSVSFGKTSMGAGKKLGNLMYLQGITGKKVWEGAYKLSTKFVENKQGKFYILNIAPDGAATPDEINMGAGYYDLLKNARRVVVDATDIEADEGAVDAGPGF